jgi:hypothetical protein
MGPGPGCVTALTAAGALDVLVDLAFPLVAL